MEITINNQSYYLCSCDEYDMNPHMPLVVNVIVGIDINRVTEDVPSQQILKAIYDNYGIDTTLVKRTSVIKRYVGKDYVNRVMFTIQNI